MSRKLFKKLNIYYNQNSEHLHLSLDELTNFEKNQFFPTKDIKSYSLKFEHSNRCPTHLYAIKYKAMKDKSLSFRKIGMASCVIILDEEVKLIRERFLLPKEVKH